MNTVQRVFLFLLVVGLGLAGFLFVRPVTGGYYRNLDCGSAASPRTAVRHSDFQNKDVAYRVCPGSDIRKAEHAAQAVAVVSLLVGGAGFLIFATRRTGDGPASRAPLVLLIAVAAGAALFAGGVALARSRSASADNASSSASPSPSRDTGRDACALGPKAGEAAGLSETRVLHAPDSLALSIANPRVRAAFVAAKAAVGQQAAAVAAAKAKAKTGAAGDFLDFLALHSDQAVPSMNALDAVCRQAGLL